jgi:hypothetical protein
MEILGRNRCPGTALVRIRFDSSPLFLPGCEAMVRFGKMETRGGTWIYHHLKKYLQYLKPRKYILRTTWFYSTS